MSLRIDCTLWAERCTIIGHKNGIYTRSKVLIITAYVHLLVFSILCIFDNK